MNLAIQKSFISPSVTIILIMVHCPVDWKSTQQVLKNDGVRYEDDHARRVAWRITKDWVEAQMALLATKSVTLPQLFLPYAVTDDGSTLYERIALKPELYLGTGK